MIVLGVEKAGLLLFGAVMSFGTRKVNGSFNESTGVAWSIYNTILATVIIIPIIAFVSVIGDTLNILIILMIVWITACVFVFIFGTKLYTLAQGEAREHISNLESNRTMTGGFSFVSVDALSQHTIGQYCTALEAHLRAVKTRRAQLVTNIADGERTLTNKTHTAERSVEGPTPGPTAGMEKGKRYSVPSTNTNSFAHEQIAPVRREAPSFVKPGTPMGVLGRLQHPRSSVSSNAVAMQPVFDTVRATSSSASKSTGDVVG